MSLNLTNATEQHWDKSKSRDWGLKQDTGEAGKDKQFRLSVFIWGARQMEVRMLLVENRNSFCLHLLYIPVCRRALDGVGVTTTVFGTNLVTMY